MGVLACAASALADPPLDAAAEASVRALALDAGFSPDPLSVPLDAGGPVEIAALSATGDCGGRVPVAPQVVVDYTAGTFPLYVTADSASDVSLAVQAPDGTWHCSDDALGRLPLVELAQPVSGRHAIFVGLSGADAAGAPTAFAILRLSELRP